jgi:hypothetical protein
MQWCLDPKKQHRLQSTLSQLTEMGFDRHQSIAGIKLKGHNVPAITDWIGSGMPFTREPSPVQFAKAPPPKKEKTFEESFIEVHRSLLLQCSCLCMFMSVMYRPIGRARFRCNIE